MLILTISIVSIIRNIIKSLNGSILKHANAGILVLKAWL
jgi:hypothetical protein